MAIQVADNFQYLGQKPLDARIKYATVADMAAVAASNLYDGIMAYVVATEKNYQWKSTNTVDPTLGKWREFESGGSADGKAESSAIAPVFDDTATYVAGDRVMYEDELYVFNKAHTGAWDAADADKSDVDSEIPDKLTSQQMQEIKDAFSGMNKGAPLRMMHYSTEEQVVGTWIDGKPVYQKTLIGTTASTAKWNTMDTGIAPNVIDKVVSFNGFVEASSGWVTSTGDADNDACTMFDVNPSTGQWEVYTNHPKMLGVSAILTIQYTKTTDQPQ